MLHSAQKTHISETKCQVNLQDPFSVYSRLWDHLLFWRFPRLVQHNHHWERDVHLLQMDLFMDLLLAYRSNFLRGQTQISIMPPHEQFWLWCSNLSNKHIKITNNWTIPCWFHSCATRAENCELLQRLKAGTTEYHLHPRVRLSFVNMSLCLCMQNNFYSRKHSSSGVKYLSETSHKIFKGRALL